MAVCRACEGSGVLLEDVCPLCEGDADFCTELSAEDPPNGSGQVDGPQVNPFSVEGEVDYDKLVDDFGCSRIDDALIQRIERLTGRRAHFLLRRGMFYTHRDLEKLLDDYERGTPFYLYTGRGPSTESLHIGHLVPFLFTKYLQDAFDVPLVVQLTDDEKFYFKDGMTLEECQRMSFENARDIIACGFDPAKTFIFRDTDYMGTMYPVVAKAAKLISYNQCHGVLGDHINANIGRVMYSSIQAAPAFPGAFPKMFGSRKDIRCLIPQGIDQDPFFRLCRAIAPRMGETKPACIHSKFLPSLQGPGSKMSSSGSAGAEFEVRVEQAAKTPGFCFDEDLLIMGVKDKSIKKQRLAAGLRIRAANGCRISAAAEYQQLVNEHHGAGVSLTVAPLPATIFMTDSANAIKHKVQRYGFSGGQDTKKLQEEYGADLQVDMPYQFLRHIMDDDAQLDQIGKDYAAGRMMTSEVKQICIDEITALVRDHKERLAKVTDDVVTRFMDPDRESLRRFMSS